METTIVLGLIAALSVWLAWKSALPPSDFDDDSYCSPEAETKRRSAEKVRGRPAKAKKKPSKRKGKR